MNIKKNYPDFASIESQIHRARVERAVVISQAILEFVTTTVRLSKMVVQAVAAGINRRAALAKTAVAEY